MRQQKKDTRKTYRENQYRVNIYWPGNRTNAAGQPYPAKYRKCELDDLVKYHLFLQFLDKNFPGWTAVNVFGGLTHEFKRQINPRNR